MEAKTAPNAGERGSFRFKREERLKGRNDIREVFSRGRRFGCRSAGGSGVKLFVLQNGLSGNRICFTFSRGYGNAVERNRARRLGREAYRHLRPRLAGGYDLVLLAYPEQPLSAQTDVAAISRKNGFALRTEQFAFLFTKAGLLR
jgi:ribonuclease P protein component